MASSAGGRLDLRAEAGEGCPAGAGRGMHACPTRAHPHARGSGGGAAARRAQGLRSGKGRAAPPAGGTRGNRSGGGRAPAARAGGRPPRVRPGGGSGRRQQAEPRRAPCPPPPARAWLALRCAMWRARAAVHTARAQGGAWPSAVRCDRRGPASPPGGGSRRGAARTPPLACARGRGRGRCGPPPQAGPGGAPPLARASRRHEGPGGARRTPCASRPPGAGGRPPSARPPRGNERPSLLDTSRLSSASSLSARPPLPSLTSGGANSACRRAGGGGDGMLATCAAYPQRCIPGDAAMLAACPTCRRKAERGVPSRASPVRMGWDAGRPCAWTPARLRHWEIMQQRRKCSSAAYA